jgi:hypothetical protein
VGQQLRVSERAYGAQAAEHGKTNINIASMAVRAFLGLTVAHSTRHVMAQVGLCDNC